MATTRRRRRSTISRLCVAITTVAPRALMRRNSCMISHAVATAWEIMQLFLRINARGATVVMATHNREIVDLLRRRVVAIDAGQIARDDRSGRYHDDFAKSEVRAQ